MLSALNEVLPINAPISDQARIVPQIELLQSLQSAVEQNLSLLTPVDKAWQPTDYLPDLTAADWKEQVVRFRAPAGELSDELLVVLVGDMITEEALPSYAISLNLIARDYSGISPDPWARWMRGWTAEENRHGDLLNAFLRLTGRVDMRAVELTIHHLLANGFDPRAYPDPYAGLIYTSFQERATVVSHANVGRLAAKQGDENLSKICAKIAADESRHAMFYTRMMGAVIEQDPAGGVLIFRQMMRRIISMPGRLMDDGKDPDLFEHFAAVAQRLGVYTVHDYVEIIRHLVKAWKIAELSLSGKAAAAQEFLCVQAERLESLADSIAEANARKPQSRFSWIHDRLA
ncbi:MAG TPA: acyl-ACP desaturase [Tepidisphaeraceae bacterium]|jgi:acyl-[acyl-carrier-protein] desaturase